MDAVEQSVRINLVADCVLPDDFRRLHV